MQFEGTEKKLELIWRSGSKRLLERNPALWEEAVRRSQATILSQIENKHCRAYLLSESSLFVWNDRVVMITCGETTLAEAGVFLLENLGAQDLQQLFFERKNERFPERQRSGFAHDISQLQSLVPEAKPMILGDAKNGHELSLLHYSARGAPPPQDATRELLMHDLALPVLQDFALARPRSCEKLRAALHGFTIDEHFFSPVGYSLNAIRKHEYATIHVTPLPKCSFASFETNAPELFEKCQEIMRIFAPARANWIHFADDFVLPELPNAYAEILHHTGKLNDNYVVEFLDLAQTLRPKNTRSPLQNSRPRVAMASTQWQQGLGR